MQKTGIAIDKISMTTLRLFVAVAQDGVLNRTANREAIAASALSKRLADLETDLQVQLFERTPRGMQLTRAGDSFLRHANHLIAAAGALSTEMSEYQLGVRGHVRLLANLSAIVAYLPEDLETFFIRHPDVSLELEERPTEQIIRGVTDGLAEIGICSSDVKLDNLASFTYRRDELVVAMRPDHELAAKEILNFNEVMPFDQIGLHKHSSIFQRVTLAARQLGLPLKHRIHVPSFDALCRTVNAGLGITLMPEPVFKLLGEPLGLVCRPLKDAWARREIVLLHQADRELSQAASKLKASLLGSPD